MRSRDERTARINAADANDNAAWVATLQGDEVRA
jgi:hypothetical protein